MSIDITYNFNSTSLTFDIYSSFDLGKVNFMLFIFINLIPSFSVVNTNNESDLLSINA